MKIVIIGTGYVGLVTGTCLAALGHHVSCMDVDAGKIDLLRNGGVPIYEPGLGELIANQVANNRLEFTTDLSICVPEAEAVFIAVGTPQQAGSGEAKLDFIYSAAKNVAKNLSGHTVIVTKSTVPVGTNRKVGAAIKKANPDADIDICSNPEFLREGHAIDDFMKPDRIVVGLESDAAKEVMRKIYTPLTLKGHPLLETEVESAELIKYASNAFLATKITFINEMADLCEKSGANVEDVAKGMGLDARIAPSFLKAGPGYGGSCFPKDTHALVHSAKQYGVPCHIVEKVIAVNRQRRIHMVGKIEAACGGSVTGKAIGVLGVAFKPDTDDMRDSPAIDIIIELRARGAIIKAYDPAAMENAAKLLPGVQWCEDAYAVSESADAVVLMTEWQEFDVLNLERLGQDMAAKVLVDLRNLYDPTKLEKAGFTYISIGR